jgi:hypothetical protein
MSALEPNLDAIATMIELLRTELRVH